MCILELCSGDNGSLLLVTRKEMFMELEASCGKFGTLHLILTCGGGRETRVVCVSFLQSVDMVFHIFTSPFCFVFHVLFLLGENIEIIL